MSLGEIQYHPMKNRILPLTLREKIIEEKKTLNLTLKGQETITLNFQTRQQMGQYRTFLPSCNRKLSQRIVISDRVFRQSLSSLERQSADSISETMNNRTFKLLFGSQPNLTTNKNIKSF
jgi:hypothetical protein